MALPLAMALEAEDGLLVVVFVAAAAAAFAPASLPGLFMAADVDDADAVEAVDIGTPPIAPAFTCCCCCCCGFDHVVGRPMPDARE